MNILLKTTLSTLLAASMLPAVPANFPFCTVSAAASVSENGNMIELESGNIKFEFLNTVYNGKDQKPKISVTSQGKSLVEGTDFSVSYPADCVNVGLKTVSISGLGGYSGTFSATYRIEPLDVSDTKVKFTAIADECTYNGFSQVPEFQVTANGVNIPASDYTQKFTNNINAGDNAACEFTFRGNFTGKRTAEFTISKAYHDDLDIEIPLNLEAANGIFDFKYDLSGLLVSGARFGSPNYSPWDFPKGNPIVAFNELQCKVSSDASNVVIGIPVVGADNYSDFSINFFFKDTNSIVPKLFISPIVREYNEDPVTEKELVSSGSYASVNGIRIPGKWIFWKDLPADPHSEVKYSCTFQPDDPQYESVDGIVSVTVNKIAAPNITARFNSERAELGDQPILTVSGVPDELVEKLWIECSPFLSEFDFEEYPSKFYTKFKLFFPPEPGIYNITVSLPEDEYHNGASATAAINYGRYIPPEHQVPDKVTTADELAKLIEAAPENGFVTAQGMLSLSESNLKAASRKRLRIEVKLNNAYTWILQTGNFSENSSSLNLELGSAVIPSVLIEKIGGTAVNSFTVNEKNLNDGAEIRITLNNSQKDKFANLFYYNTDGELDFCSCARIDADNTVRLPLTKSGKFVVITDNETKLFGDINDDGKFKLNDLYDLLYIYTNRLSTPDKLRKHDIDGDGVFLLKDLYLLLNIYTNSM